MMTFGSLFAGIGGLDLGLERAGMECVWQVENDEYATRVLEKHWPDVARYGDVRDCHGAEACPNVADAESRREAIAERRIAKVGKGRGLSTGGGCATCLQSVDLICGGFPCQDVSLAGKRAGLAGKRTTLWDEFARIIRELRPRWVLAENVPGLYSANDGRFFGKILRDLAESGYDAEWDCIPAAAVGAPHRRYRVFIVAHAESQHRRNEPSNPGNGTQRNCRSIFDASRKNTRFGNAWATEPDVGRVADGVPARVDRLRCLGNAVVPQVAEWIGRRIMGAEGP